MEGMDLPNHRRSLSQPKHGMKGSNLNQECATSTPNELIKITPTEGAVICPSRVTPPYGK